jgi:hypothetical protein
MNGVLIVIYMSISTLTAQFRQRQTIVKKKPIWNWVKIKNIKEFGKYRRIHKLVFEDN